MWNEVQRLEIAKPAFQKSFPSGRRRGFVVWPLQLQLVLRDDQGPSGSHLRQPGRRPCAETTGPRLPGTSWCVHREPESFGGAGLLFSQLQLRSEFRCEDMVSAWTLPGVFNLNPGSGIHFSGALPLGAPSPAPPTWRRRWLMVGHSSPQELWPYTQKHQRSWGRCCPSSVLRNYQQNLGSAEEGKKPQTGSREPWVLCPDSASGSIDLA